MVASARELSKVVFGSPFRLEIAAGIHRIRKAPFTTAELQAVLDDPLDRDNNAGRQLKRLAEANLVDNVGQLWSPQESALWEFCDNWLDHLLK